MSVSTEAPVTPDLSSLTPRQRLNIAVALTQGYAWEEAGVNDPEPFMWLVAPNALPVAADGDGFSRCSVEYWGPDYATDPAAWGALMEKEGDVWPEPLFHSGEGPQQWWQGCWMDPRRALPATAVGDFAMPGPAVCAAVLMKHGIDPTPYIGE